MENNHFNVSYQINKVLKATSYKRIETKIPEIPEIINYKLDRNKNVVFIEYTGTEDVMKQKLLKLFLKFEKGVDFLSIECTEVFRKVLVLKGLDCGHCAMRINNLAKKTFNYDQIVVDFASERFIIETKDQELADHIIERVSEVAHKIDPNIKVLDLKNEKKVRDQETYKVNPLDLKFLGLGCFFLICALLSTDLKEMFISIFNSEEYPLGIVTELCLLVAYIFFGFRVLAKFIHNIKRGNVFDENFLMTIASIGAILTGHHIEAVMVMALYRIGTLLQERAVNRARRSISELLNIEATSAHLLVGNEITDVEVESILKGDYLVVRNGEIIPVDGIITEGKTYLDTKALTGESAYRTVKKGEEVLSGMVNMGSIITMKVSRPHNESTTSKVLDMVENASALKAKAEDFITKFASYYTPIVTCIALLVATLLPIVTKMFFPTHLISYADSIYRSMVFLVISCPCALVISIPLTYFAGIGLGSKRGILIKGSNYLEALSNIENVIFDKTGTLTKGEFRVQKVVSKIDISEDEIWKLIAYAEYYSTHPIGMSIVEQYGRDKIFPDIIADFKEYSGRGVHAQINGKRIFIGNTRLLKEKKVDYPQVSEDGLILHVLREKVYLGYVVIGDALRDEAIDTMHDLHQLGVKNIAILTGDAYGIANSIGQKLGVDDVYADLLPDQKVEKLHEIKANAVGNAHTIYIGDGINDTPVLSSADVGIAMGGTGSSAAIAIADVVIMTDNLKKVTESIEIAKRTNKLVKQNTMLAIGIKFIVLILGLFNLVTIWVAIFSDVGVSLLAILNSMRITRLYKNEEKKEKLLMVKNDETN